jgi:hypothetical protein
MNQELIDLLKQGVTVWNSQRPRLAAPPEIRAEYEQYARRIAEAEAVEPYGYEYPNVLNYEDFLLSRGGGVDLRRAELRGMDLRGYDLSYCTLVRAQMGGADLRGANLHKCSLVDANISGADLRGAQIQHANLTNAMVCDALLEPASYEAMRAKGGRSRYMRGFFFAGRPSLSLDEWGAILDEYHRRCAYCGDSYELMDHFVLRSKGGQV